MPRAIEAVVRLTIRDKDSDVNRLWRRVRDAHDEAGHELLVRVLEAVDEAALENHSDVMRPRRVERHSDTTLGRVVFEGLRVKRAGNELAKCAARRRERRSPR